MESLKVDVTIEYNGKKIGNGFDFSDFLNEERELKADYVIRVLTNIIKTITRTLQRMRLVHPYVIMEESEK